MPKSKKASKAAKSRHKEKYKQELKEGISPLRVKVEKKVPPVRKYSYIEYDFLKYVRLVFKWAKENYPELKRADLEMLLYLYPIGAFSKRQFSLYHKTMGLYAVSKMKKLEKGGWIKLWRPRSGKESALYSLTTKAKALCNRMHKLSCGAEKMPTDPRYNKINREDAPRANTYYLDAIKRMNKDEIKKEEN